MELVFENGQILAKGHRSNVFSLQNQRTKSIMDLYEAEYNEDFKKINHGGGGSIKNLVETQVVQDHHVVAAEETNMMDQEIDFCESNNNKHVDESTLVETVKASSSKKMMADYEKRKNIEFIPPDEQSVVAERSIESCFDSSWTDFTEDTEGSTYLLSSSLDDESDDARQRVPGRTGKDLVKRKQSTEVYNNSPEGKQRNEINKKMRTLQDLLPNSHKDDNETTLDEAINYMTTLQNQVQMMTRGNRFVTPPMMLPLGPYYSQMGLGMGMGMQMGAPQFLPGISDSANMLRFLNHPGLMPVQNSSLFTPMEIYSPQSAPPSCAASPDEIPNSTSFPNLDDATTYTRNQGTVTDGGILSGKKSENYEQRK